MSRALFVLAAVLCLAPGAAATTIASETVSIDAGDRAEVTVTRTYADIDRSHRLSYLAPARYDPRDLTARDGIGRLDCDVDETDIGTEIVCEPRKNANYTVTFSFTGDLVDVTAHNRLTFFRRVFVPTEHTRVEIRLPEGHGVVEGDPDAVQPPNATTGSEGRRIFLAWEDQDPNVGDTVQYVVTYEELAALERYVSVPVAVAGGLLILALLAAIAYLLYSRTREKTIADVFPVLKPDEQEVVRYIIDHDDDAVEQREIVSSLDYSKAKISSLLSDLEERNLITKEKQGRVNVVRLTREVGELE